jgi:hypothetical protein
MSKQETKNRLKKLEKAITRQGMIKTIPKLANLDKSAVISTTMTTTTINKTMIEHLEAQKQSIYHNNFIIIDVSQETGSMMLDLLYYWLVSKRT